MALQAEGRRFESVNAHRDIKLVEVNKRQKLQFRDKNPVNLLINRILLFIEWTQQDEKRQIKTEGSCANRV